MEVAESTIFWKAVSYSSLLKISLTTKLSTLTVWKPPILLWKTAGTTNLNQLSLNILLGNLKIALSPQIRYSFEVNLPPPEVGNVFVIEDTTFSQLETTVVP